MKTLKLITAALLTTLAVSAQASFFSISGGEDVSTSGDNYLFGPPDAAFPSYNIGGNVSATDNIFITYTLIGFESTWDQAFLVGGNPVLQKSGEQKQLFPSGEKAYSTASAGELLDFRFQAFHHNSGNLMADVANGTNVSPDPDSPEFPSFATVFNVEYGGVFYDAILMFDDTGNNDDDNHDDFVIGVNARVPEPSILLLMGLGLIGLFGARSRKV